MRWLATIAGIVLLVSILVDAFEAVALPRRVKHGYRLSPLFYRASWLVWRALARFLPERRWRAGFLSVFGPLSLFALLALWALGLITAFAMLHWSRQSALSIPGQSAIGFIDYLYFSGTNFFTLGYGDIVATGVVGRAFGVAEAGVGFGFLAIVISYVPVFYQTFSRREITISLLDGRAGSPPTACELIHRLAEARSVEAVRGLLVEWERWAAEVLESHLSFPVVCYYRSQHDNQSWIATLTFILDTSSLLIASLDGANAYQAKLTFAMARHAAVDLGLVFGCPPVNCGSDRVQPSTIQNMRQALRAAGHEVPEEDVVTAQLSQLRVLYEPFVNALANYFELPLPPFQPTKRPIDNWQTTPWTAPAPSITSLPGPDDWRASSYEDLH